MRLFDKPNWTFDHTGVRFIGLDTVVREYLAVLSGGRPA